MGTKIGPGIVAAIVTGMLTAGGYISSSSGGAVQPQEALDTIVFLYQWAPLVIWVVVLIGGLLYGLDKIYPQIMEDLAEREARGEM